MADYYEKRLKLQKYKELLEQNIVLNGDLPNIEYINSLLTNIDTRLAMLAYDPVNTEKKFDTDKLNKDLNMIALDLNILYEIIFKYEKEMLSDTEQMLETMLYSLENKSKQASELINVELNASSLGNTKYFYDSFNLQRNGQDIYIDIGALEFDNYSRVTFFVNGLGINDKTCLLQLDDKHTLLPYAKNHSYLDLKDESKIIIQNTYKYTNPGNQQQDTFVINSLKNLDDSHIYRVFAGKDCLKQIGKNTLIDIANKPYIHVTNKSSYKFFVNSATFVEFNFSKPLLNKNFDSYRLDGPIPNMKMFFFECDEDTDFIIKTDGTIYATPAKCNISDGCLYITDYLTATTFLIQEYKSLGTISFPNVKMIIKNATLNDIYINSAAIKEADILALEANTNGVSKYDNL